MTSGKIGRILGASIGIAATGLVLNQIRKFDKSAIRMTTKRRRK